MPKPFQAGVKAQHNSEFGGSCDIIHREDGFRECANFARPAMNRIKSIARCNLAGRHPVPSVALLQISRTSAHCSAAARTGALLQCGTNSWRAVGPRRRQIVSRLEVSELNSANSMSAFGTKRTSRD